MLDWIKKLFHLEAEHSADGLNQTQREAIIDLLLLSMYADNFLSFKEDEFLKTESHRLAWTCPSQSLDGYIDGATARARAALQDAASRGKFLAGVAARLGDPEVKERALELCQRLLICDDQGQEAEVKFFREISDAFEKSGQG